MVMRENFLRTSLASRLPTNKAFTLIELLVVLAIVAVLLTLALPRYFGSIQLGRERVLVENLRVTRDIIDKYYVDHGHYPDSLSVLVEQHYLKAMPWDPVSENDSSWQVVMPPSGRGRGVFDLHSGAPGLTRDGKTFSSL